MKKLYKSRKSKIFTGVIGGVGEYFNIDPVLLRIVWLLFVIFTGLLPGSIVYMVATFIVPENPDYTDSE